MMKTHSAVMLISQKPKADDWESQKAGLHVLQWASQKSTQEIRSISRWWTELVNTIIKAEL